MFTPHAGVVHSLKQNDYFLKSHNQGKRIDSPRCHTKSMDEIVSQGMALCISALVITNHLPETA